MTSGVVDTHSARRSYANVMLVQRVLAVLQSVNAMPVITIKAISEACAIPRCSVVRIVETLCAEGYLIHLSRSAGYMLSPKVRALSAGFHGAPMLVELLRDDIDALTRRHLWPFCVATLDRDAMVVQYSSLPLSPLAHVPTTLHKRLSLLSRAHGIAYLAHCGSLERHRLLRLAAGLRNPEDGVIANAGVWRRQIAAARQRGYALRASEADPFTRTIAVPIMPAPGRVAATLGVTFFRRVVNDVQQETLATALIACARDAAARICRQGDIQAQLPADHGSDRHWRQHMPAPAVLHCTPTAPRRQTRDMSQALEDKDKIREAMAKYCHALDAGRFADVAALFLADGEWTTDYGAARGRAEIETLLGNTVPLKGEGPQRKHYITNTVIRLDGDTAHCVSDYLIIRESETGLIPVMGGTYKDTFRRHGDGWYFARKELVHDIVGDMALKNKR